MNAMIYIKDMGIIALMSVICATIMFFFHECIIEKNKFKETAINLLRSFSGKW